MECGEAVTFTVTARVEGRRIVAPPSIATVLTEEYQ